MAQPTAADGPAVRLLDDSQEPAEELDHCQLMKSHACLLPIDIPASIVFWYLFLFYEWPASLNYHAVTGVWVGLMILWRLLRIYLKNGAVNAEEALEVPYSCNYIKMNNREVIVVATIHISPKSPDDVNAVILDGKTKPDVVMIELDDERLDRMRGFKVKEAEQDDLQEVAITTLGDGQRTTLYAQRAVWNAEFEKDTLVADIFFDPENPHGAKEAPSGVKDKLVLVKRGDPDKVNATFAQKAFLLAKAGAKGILVMNDADSRVQLPPMRLGTSSPLMEDLKLSMKYCSCGLPPLPVLLLSHHDSEQIKASLENGGVKAEITIRDDKYPRRTLRKRICQGCALMLSGIGVLYGVIGCFNVDVGGEFIAAEETATKEGLPCVCVDVNMNDFWSKVGRAMLPTPYNLFEAAWSWLTFPRNAFRFFFPRSDGVDVLGLCVLHAFNFTCRTWVAFMIAGYFSSQVTSHILKWLVGGATDAAVAGGAVKQKDAADTQVLIMLGLELYILPRVYQAIAARRDEVMYLQTKAKAREHNALRSVLVVGAAHSNGILHYIRTYGL